MNTIVRLVAASFLIGAASRADDKKADPKPEEPIKVVVEHLDRAFGIKSKSVAVKAGVPNAQETEIKITLEFSKDVADAKAMKDALFAYSGVPIKYDGLPLVFHLFDEDNVSVEKLVIRMVEGDLTGVKGDAFRIYLVTFTETFKKAKKVEARLANPPKPGKE